MDDGNSARRQPTLRIDRWYSRNRHGESCEQSQLVLSLTAYQAIGSPLYVRIQYNASKQMIRLEPANSAVRGARTIRLKKDGRGAQVGSVERLVKYGGIRSGKFAMTRPGIFVRVAY